MSFDYIMGDLGTYIMVFCRVAGIIGFNPLLARNNMPTNVRMALVLGITIVIGKTVPTYNPFEITEYAFVMAIVAELFIGFICGMIFQVFYYMLFAVGDIIDMGFGLSMAKAFDPATNIQISMSGNIFQLLFVMYIFATNSHLILIKMIAYSYEIINIGGATIGPQPLWVVIELLATVFTLAMQLAAPFMATSFILEMSMGILMKVIPQINVFVINFQFKVTLGITLLFLFAEPVSAFVMNYMDSLFRTMYTALEFM